MILAKTRHVFGFSLIELLIAIVLVGVLVAISLPSYQASIHTGRRGDAKAELLRLAQEQAKWRVSNTTYGDLSTIGGATANSDYVYSVTTHTSTTFTITATPTSTHGQNQDICGTLIIDQHANLRSFSNPSGCPKP